MILLEVAAAKKMMMKEKMAQDQIEIIEVKANLKVLLIIIVQLIINIKNILVLF